jgi:hypothetical protein
MDFVCVQLTVRSSRDRPWPLATAPLADNRWSGTTNPPAATFAKKCDQPHDGTLLQPGLRGAVGLLGTSWHEHDMPRQLRLSTCYLLPLLQTSPPLAPTSPCPFDTSHATLLIHLTPRPQRYVSTALDYLHRPASLP